MYKFSDFRFVLGKALFYYLKANFYNVAILGAAKSTVDSLRLPLIQDFWIAYSRDTEEQSRIVSAIQLEERKIDDAENMLAMQIEKLMEYKDTIINNAVTGKIRVA